LNKKSKEDILYVFEELASINIARYRVIHSCL